MTGLQCGHKFCTSCWDSYLTDRITEVGMGHSITCPAHKCDITVDDETVMRLVTDQTAVRHYQHSITNSFVLANRFLSWCNSPGCTNAIKVYDSDVLQVQCSCTNRFCFGCGDSWHEPLECRLMKEWMTKRQRGMASHAWIQLNSKECPKCSVPIFKDGGCNHMVSDDQLSQF